MASDEWRVRIQKNALGHIPGKHRKSAQMVEGKGDVLHSDAKERCREAGRGGIVWKLEGLLGGLAYGEGTHQGGAQQLITIIASFCDLSS